MKQFKRLTALLLCLAMMLCLFGCDTAQEATEPTVTEPIVTEPPAPDAAELYADARAALESASHISLELLITTYTTVAGDRFSEQSIQTLTYKDMGTEEALIVLDEDIYFSVHSSEDADNADEEEEEDEAIVYQEIWYQGNVYAELEDTYRYSGTVDAEAAAARYTPVVLLNAELYSSFTSEATDSGLTITFADPTAAESWAMPQDAELVDASGTAVISAEGEMEEMRYTITYIYGPAEVTLEVQSKLMDTPEDVTAPANPDNYECLGYVDALRISMCTPIMLMQADNVTTSSLESMFCQAAAFVRNQSTIVNLAGRKEDTKAKIEYGIFVKDYSSGQEQELDHETTFVDGKQTTVTNNGLPSTEKGISWKDVRVSATELMLYGMLDMDYWQDVTMTDMGSVYLLEYQLNENFGNTMQNGICQMLWDDPSFLYNLASKYENAELNGYLSVDKYTGLPVAAGYYYQGIHTIEGQDYELTLQYDQSIEAPSLGAYHEITEEMPEEAEPEIKATPLFYHVTGENGQEMWLFGTIHVGDERTAYLPEEIYNAFAASDALALECNTEAFDEQLEEDDDLSEQVSNLYYFSDGTTVESLIAEYEAEHAEEAEEAGETDDAEEEEDAYALAVKLMKATGNYNMNMPYAKPYLWSSSIENFYLRQGCQLHGDQGVEERLMDWAEELDKEILEVESSLFQIRMTTGFSNDLQMLLLADSMNSTAQEYWTGVMDLYEKWCAGDEAVLREELSDEVDMTDWTEEEIAEYEEYKHLLDEYNKAMIYDRNDGMLKKAIEYLESDKVVFYAVGLAHLLNDVNGLVDALREAGYTVELVQYN